MDPTDPLDGLPRGSGNVFADLGFDDAEALQVKAVLTYHIYNRIKALGLTQKEAVARLGISRPDVSRLMHCKHTGFSSDRLLAFLVALDRGMIRHVAGDRAAAIMRDEEP